MTEDKLKPCPFCGCDAEIIKSEHNDYFRVTCSYLACVIHSDYLQKDEAIEEWNDRGMVK